MFKSCESMRRTTCLLLTTVLLAGLECGAMPARKGCGPRLANTAKDSWTARAFTDPANYSPNQKFRFLVHATADETTRLVQMINTLKTHLSEERQYTGHLDLLRNPERLAERQLVSASVITEKNLATWAGAGLIIAPHPENVVATSTSDIGSQHGLGLSFAGDELSTYVARMAGSIRS